MNDQAEILRVILADYKLSILGDHGVNHWARVLENGLEIAKVTGADIEVVALFALFHDSRRVNEFIDDEHGMRGGDFARSLRDTLVLMDDTKFELLFEACRLHTCGYMDGDPTILTCYDADRLDLGRVGLVVDPNKLCTDAARSLQKWANFRAVRGYKPSKVLTAWKIATRFD